METLGKPAPRRAVGGGAASSVVAMIGCRTFIAQICAMTTWPVDARAQQPTIPIFGPEDHEAPHSSKRHVAIGTKSFVIMTRSGPSSRPMLAASISHAVRRIVHHSASARSHSWACLCVPAFTHGVTKDVGVAGITRSSTTQSVIPPESCRSRACDKTRKASGPRPRISRRRSPHAAKRAAPACRSGCRSLRAPGAKIRCLRRCGSFRKPRGPSRIPAWPPLN
jgi:hypothetical protein